ncbi:N-formylglutamate deformylase [alternative form] [[Actinomadura] parvosata subsp. kistnae]|nr:N-formylglutamate deformylase [alternative form] [Actinomadura parvosata subsp. kistnae]
MVRGRGPAARARPARGPQRQPLGLVGHPVAAAPRRRHRQPPRLRTAGRRVRRPARRCVRLRRARPAARAERDAGRPRGRGLLQRRGGRQVRRAVRGVAAAHRRARARAGARAHRRRRRHPRRRAEAGRAPARRAGARRRDAGLRRHVRRAARGAGPRAGRRGRPVGVASAIWPHGRWRFDFRGRADHAGTTRLADRDDPMLPLARMVLAAREAAERRGVVATVGKVRVSPGNANAIPGLASAWLDARGPDEHAVRALVAELAEAAGATWPALTPPTTPDDATAHARPAGLTDAAALARAGGAGPAQALARAAGLDIAAAPGGAAAGGHAQARARAADAGDAQALAARAGAGDPDGRGRAAGSGGVVVREESWTPVVAFEAALRDRVARAAGGDTPAPILPTGAGHDAGILAAAGVPSAMLFVRNPTGVSHAPDEHAERADCEAGVVALADVLEELCR